MAMVSHGAKAPTPEKWKSLYYQVIRDDPDIAPVPSRSVSLKYMVTV
jgi:hypothetical protein